MKLRVIELDFSPEESQRFLPMLLQVVSGAPVPESLAASAEGSPTAIPESPEAIPESVATQQVRAIAGGFPKVERQPEEQQQTRALFPPARSNKRVRSLVWDPKKKAYVKRPWFLGIRKFLGKWRKKKSDSQREKSLDDQTASSTRIAVTVIVFLFALLAFAVGALISEHGLVPVVQHLMGTEEKLSEPLMQPTSPPTLNENGSLLDAAEPPIAPPPVNDPADKSGLYGAPPDLSEGALK